MAKAYWSFKTFYPIVSVDNFYDKQTNVNTEQPENWNLSKKFQFLH